MNKGAGCHKQSVKQQPLGSFFRHYRDIAVLLLSPDRSRSKIPSLSSLGPRQKPREKLVLRPRPVPATTALPQTRLHFIATKLTPPSSGRVPQRSDIYRRSVQYSATARCVACIATRRLLGVGPLCL